MWKKCGKNKRKLLKTKREERERIKISKRMKKYMRSGYTDWSVTEDRVKKRSNVRKIQEKSNEKIAKKKKKKKLSRS